MRDGGEGETARESGLGSADSASFDVARLEGVVLARLAVAAGGATASDVVRDVRPLVAGLPGSWIRPLVSRAIERHLADGSIVDEGRRLRATAAGSEAARRLLGCKGRLPRGWPEARDVYLVARALGLEKATTTAKRGLRRVEGLRAALLVERHALPLKGAPSVARLRAALAKKATAEKATIEESITEKAITEATRQPDRRASHRIGRKRKQPPCPPPALTPDRQRELAASLAGRACSITSDARLVADLAADAVGAASGTLEALRAALLADFILPGRGASRLRTAMTTASETSPSADPAAAACPEPTTDGAALRGSALERVARLVDLHARAVATGWHGDRKAFISRVWRSIRAADPKTPLAEADFKRLLVEAHTAGKVALAFADLKDSAADAEIRASAVLSRNVVWHYVRVVDRADPSG